MKTHIWQKWTVTSLLLACVGLAMAGIETAAPPAADSTKFGKRLLAQYPVDSKIIDKIAAHQVPESKPGESKFLDLNSNSVDWRGPEMDGDANANPYNIVISIKAKAINKGAVSASYVAGFGGEDGLQRLVPITGLSANEVNADASIFLVSNPLPFSFKESRRTYPYANYLQSENLVIDQVWVQVWTGMSDTPKWQYVTMMPWFWVGALLLGLFWWFRRGQ